MTPSGRPPNTRISITSTPVPMAKIHAPRGVTGEVTVSARGWGTEVGFDLAQLPPDETCIAWAVGDDGEWQQVAWWGPTPTHRARVTGASSLQLDDVAEIVVTTTDRDEIVTRAPLSGQS